MDSAAAPAAAPAAPAARPSREIPLVDGAPLLGNVLEMARDPARFFYECYRKHGPVFRFKLLGRTCTVLAGPHAAHWMGTREGKECLRSREFWEGLTKEYKATQSLPGVDGERHKQLRDVLRHGYSRESILGRYNELIAITDRSIERDWKSGAWVYPLPALQMMVTDQLGTILTGRAPLEYVADIRLTILYILNVLITRQRPKFFLWNPAVLKHPDVLRRVHAEVDALFAGRRQIEESEVKTLPVLNGAIMEAMRLLPVAVAQMRTSTKPFVFEGFEIPANEMLYMGTAVPHFMHEFYPDPLKFDPDQDRPDAGAARQLQGAREGLPSLSFPSFPRKRESSLLSPLDSRFRGHDERA